MNKIISASVASFLAIFALSFGIAACGNDASVDTRDKGSAKAIINMPDHFPSIALKCRGAKGVYTTNNTAHGSGSPFVVLNDPECKTS